MHRYQKEIEYLKKKIGILFTLTNICDDGLAIVNISFYVVISFAKSNSTSDHFRSAFKSFMKYFNNCGFQ